MLSTTVKRNEYETVMSNHYVKVTDFLDKVRNDIWLFGIPFWGFGITDRTLAAFADGDLSVIEIVHLFTISLFLMSWLYLKPDKIFNIGNVDIQSYNPDSNPSLPEKYLGIAGARMFDLREQHVIGQEYILPFPYLCQIYHLLNLKHLETIHNFSLNNLKVVKVSNLHPTEIGGMVKFQTILDSPVNPLRIWRQPIVEVGLILHTPYTVELNIPAYNNKRIIVIFNVLPLSNTEHKLFIDIYSNLKWPKPLLQLLLHFASGLTLFEDLPYLQKLAASNLHRLFDSSKVSNHETMGLFKRFVDLYGSSIKLPQ